MVGLYYALPMPTVDTLALQTTLKTSDNGLTCQQIVELGARYGLALTVHHNTTLNDIRSEIDNGKPVIVLLAYRAITEKMDKADNVPGRDGHFVVVSGYSGSTVTLQDPDWFNPHITGGHNFVVPAAELAAGIADINHDGQCVFVNKDKTMANSTFLQSLLGDVKNLEAKIVAEIAAESSTPVPAPTPAPTGTAKAMVVNDPGGVNVRKQPSVRADVMGTLANNAAVNLINDVDADGYTWGKIADGQFAGGYVAQKFFVLKA